MMEKMYSRKKAIGVGAIGGSLAILRRSN